MNSKTNKSLIVGGIIVLAAIAFFVIASMVRNGRMDCKSDESCGQEGVASDTQNSGNGQNAGSTLPIFVIEAIQKDSMIDKVYKYAYEGLTYYYLGGQEKVDGVPEVYTSSGEQIDCNFKSPMIPKSPDDEPVNPICGAYSTGTLVYERN